MAKLHATTPQSAVRMGSPFASPYEGVALLADPIHRYIVFTVPRDDRSERTEKDVIDSSWVQRLRRIHQLQSTWWVYPSGEHSRFQHVLGTMHMAGAFARHLYPSLKETFGETLPSAPFIEELLRLAGLLHDVGHGPFGHFFDDHFLKQFHVRGERLNHEILGMAIIMKKLGGAPMRQRFTVLHAREIRHRLRFPLARFAALIRQRRRTIGVPCTS